jgi:aerobic carbon-monoxide dehydrogenase large subunit
LILSSERMRLMNIREAPEDLALHRFGIGQPVRRTEDPRLVRGQGRFTDDIDLPNQVYAAIIRSRHAHGIIRDVDVGPALEQPGVLGAYTGKDLARAGFGTLSCLVGFKNRDGTEMRKPPRPALPIDKVRFVGDPIAFVVADTPARAKDAAEAVIVSIDPLPAVIDLQDALRPDAPQLYDEAPGNIALDYHYGDPAKVAAAFAEAAHITRLRLVNSRLVVNAMEPRAAIGLYDAQSQSWTLYSGSQGVMGLRTRLATDILKVAPEKVRVLSGNVGGSFGMKGGVYPEYVCLLHAARELGRPVKWTNDRSESFVSDHHGRDSEFLGELALDAKGRFLAVRLTGLGNMGGYLGAMSPLMQTLNIVKNATSVYRTPQIEVSTKCVFTNTTVVGPYRGAGRPEGNYFMERLIDVAAAESGIDRLALRRRNHVRPNEMPCLVASGMTYDSGDFGLVFERAIEVADYKGFKERKRQSRKRGMLRGLGVGSYLEVTSPPNKELAAIRFEADDTVTILTGTFDHGQGHHTAFAQVLSDRLGIPFERIRVVQGDSSQLTAGSGTGGSRSIMASGTAILEAAAQVVERGRMLASTVLEAAAGDIEFDAGRFLIAGTDRGIDILELAAKVRAGLTVGEDGPQSLDVNHLTDPIPSAFPNGCHVAEVEIDPQTGTVEVVKYSSVNDFGTIINPLLVEGQLHGGIVQGIGQVIFERTAYDADGQLLTASFMDYAMPRASVVPEIHFESHPVPARSNPLGAKGCGEAGCAGALTAVANAIVDALAHLGIRHVDLPATPERIWRAIERAQTEIS